MARDMYVVVSERDSDDPLDNGGSIIYETYTRDSELHKAKERVRSMGGRFGEAKIFKLVPVEDEIEAEVNGGAL